MTGGVSDCLAWGRESYQGSKVKCKDETAVPISHILVLENSELNMLTLHMKSSADPIIAIVDLDLIDV